MINYLSHDLIIHMIFFQAVILLVLLSNLYLIHHARKHPAPDVLPMVSILVPARNEELNIAGCVWSLLAQDYPSFEVLVLDDQSTDSTHDILIKIAQTNPRLKVISGSPPSGNQSGKNWACSQLARQAGGEILFFTDADTQHKPQTLFNVVTTLIGERADLLTGFPRQSVITWGEKLLVPFFPWASLCFIPLGLGYKLRLPGLTAAVGQLMVFRREAYFQIGGHELLGTAIVDDLTLARKIKTAGFRWRVASVSDLVSCRMYRGFKDAVEGFTKNLFAAFDFRLLIYLFVFIWLLILFLLPLIVLGFWILGLVPSTNTVFLLINIFLSLIIWMIPYHEIGVPLSLGLVYPVTILINGMVAVKSLKYSLTGQLTWKDRQLSKPTWRW